MKPFGVRTPRLRLVLGLILFFGSLGAFYAMGTPRAARESGQVRGFDRAILDNAEDMLAEGRRIFRYDTFGDEDFWGGTLRLHEAVRQLTPRQALGLGLKVDATALPQQVLNQIRQGRVNLDDPAVTLLLLQRNAVVGVTGFFTGSTLTSIGIQCAFCHSTVDDSVAPGIGLRLDGWANRDLNVGEIIAAAPDLSLIASLLGKTPDEVRTVLRGWGVGKFDAELLLDGKTEGPNGSAATLLPPAFGLAGVNGHTWTGNWGTVSYWNAFVANLEMRGKGTFFDPRLDNAEQYPVAAAHPELFGHKRDEVDLISSKVPALHYYQLSIPAPAPPPGSFDEAAFERGDALFSGKAQCASCHVEPTGSEPGWNFHRGEDLCIDNFQADRAPDHVYRTSPLNGLWTHTKGGFFHDGRFATLAEVVDHYDDCFNLGLTASEQRDLVEYLKGLPEEE
ncbi:MAG TPA: hypothetical protein VFV75_12735 [Candidatus Polarisedimenticolaceae bacterium]|nr:hypothetical protein [Candidatus Polarisedimenticolaceae bacterium]